MNQIIKLKWLIIIIIDKFLGGTILDKTLLTFERNLELQTLLL